MRTRQASIADGVIRLQPNNTKNDEGREVTLTMPLRELLRECIRGKGPDAPVFTRRDGSAVKDFRKT